MDREKGLILWLIRKKIVKDAPQAVNFLLIVFVILIVILIIINLPLKKLTQKETDIKSLPPEVQERLAPLLR